MHRIDKWFFVRKIQDQGFARFLYWIVNVFLLDFEDFYLYINIFHNVGNYLMYISCPFFVVFSIFASLFINL